MSVVTRALVSTAMAATAVLVWSASPVSAEPASPSWLYNSPHLASSDEGATITADPAPSGAAWTLHLDPARTYRVTISGRLVAHRFSLRTQADEGPLRYLRAPDGTMVMRTHGASTLDLLFYSDTAGAAYRLNSITVRECGDSCQTDRDLKAELLANVPGLDGALARGDDLRAAELILAWISPRIPFADGATTGPVSTNGMSAAEIYYDNLEPGTGGVFCGGAADFLQKVLSLFGIEVRPVDFGVPGTDLTHVTTMFERESKPGSASLYVLDPSFGMTLSVGDGDGVRRASVTEALRLLIEGRDPLLSAKTADLRGRELVSRDSPSSSPTTRRCGADPLHTACSLDTYLAGTRREFEANGYNAGFRGWLELLGRGALFDNGAAPPQELVRIREEIAGRPVPLADPAATVVNDEPGTSQALGSASTGRVTGSNLAATADPLFGGGESASVWYRWTAPEAGIAVAETCRATFDTVLSVYSPSDVWHRPVATDDDGCAVGNGSRLSFAVDRCATYLLSVDGFAAGTGNFTLGVAGPASAAPCAVDRPPELTGGGANQAVETEIVKGPPRRLRQGRAWFRFRSNPTDASFLCRLDGGPERPCGSRMGIRTAPGRHTLRVSAIDRSLSRDLTPAVWRWRTLRRG